jgi:hypothetical protein
VLALAGASCSRSSSSSNASIPRTADGKPDLQGIWQVRNRAAADLEDYVARAELLEVACHEDNQDLQHLKEIRDEARAKARSQS